jgi:hypothetical protein
VVYESSGSGRVEVGGSDGGRVGETGAAFWSYDAVEARLVEAVRCRWRMSGGGRWPFAGDGPWHLIPKAARAETLADFLLDQAQMGRDEAPREGPPSRAEIGAMEEAEEWLTYVEDDGQRVALAGGLIDRTKGRKRVGWKALRDRLGEAVTPAGLERRYARAVALIAGVLNATAGGGVSNLDRGLGRLPEDVRRVVERLKMAENCGGRLSSPEMIER